MDKASRLRNLLPPNGPVDVVMDTDTFNEIDDQFALAYLLRSQERLTICGIYAAPFHNHHSDSAGDGMERSYQEILNVMEMLGERSTFENRVFRGSDTFLPDEKTPVHSAAVEHLIAQAMAHTPENPLYVLAIAAATNIASALLIEPRIAERMVVIWHGGVALHWPGDPRSFNAGQDIAAGRVLLDSGVPLVLQPGRGVVDMLTTTGPELAYHLGGKSKFCDYMIQKTAEEAAIYYDGTVWSRPLFDVAAVAWLLPGKYMKTAILPTPVLGYDLNWTYDDNRPEMCYVYVVHRDNILGDLFAKLAKKADS